MNLDEILRKFPSNAGLSAYAEECRRLALQGWIASDAHPDRKHQIACTRADILLYACELRVLLGQYTEVASDAVRISSTAAITVKLCEQQVALEFRLLQTYLDLLDDAEELPVECGESAARANSRVSHLNRLVEEQRANASIAKTLATVRKMIVGLAPAAE